MTYLLIDTGCRRGELMDLKWENVELDTGLLVIDHARLYSSSKGTYEALRAGFDRPKPLEMW